MVFNLKCWFDCVVNGHVNGCRAAITARINARNSNNIHTCLRAIESRITHD